MSNTATIIWKSIGIGLVTILLIAAVVWGYEMTPDSVPCSAIHYTIADQNERMYFAPNELNQLLQSEHVYPVGQHLNSISLHRIERVVAQHPMVRTAECYLTPRNEVRIVITQRVPLVRVKTQMETYLVDTDRRVMQARATVRDSVLVATGAVNAQMAVGQLADFAQWLQDNRYWRARVHHVQVNTNQKVYLYMRGEEIPRVLIGSLNGYESKLAKLRTFLEEQPDTLRTLHYNELDIRFKGQVIGRR